MEKALELFRNWDILKEEVETIFIPHETKRTFVAHGG